MSLTIVAYWCRLAECGFRDFQSRIQQNQEIEKDSFNVPVKKLVEFVECIGILEYGPGVQGQGQTTQ